MDKPPFLAISTVEMVLSHRYFLSMCNKRKQNRLCSRRPKQLSKFGVIVVQISIKCTLLTSLGTTRHIKFATGFLGKKCICTNNYNTMTSIIMMYQN